MISITFKGNVIKLHDINIILLNDLTFSLIIFIWYILFKIGLLTYFSPLLGLIITFIQNMLLLIYFFRIKKINLNNAVKYLIIMVILKILPIISFYPDQFIIKPIDVFALLYLYIFYIIFIIILGNIYHIKYDLQTIIYNDVSGIKNEDSINYKIYDTAYNSIINSIIK